jgi:hypothetical protein
MSRGSRDGLAKSRLLILEVGYCRLAPQSPVAARDDTMTAFRFLREHAIARRHATAAHAQDVDVTLEIWPKMTHAWPMQNLPTAAKA